VIEIEYVVRDQKGVERLRTTDKKAADAYDKALETAERLADLLRHDRVLPSLSEPDMEELTIYLARNARNIERILKGKGPEPDAAAEPVAEPEAVATRDKVTPLRAAG
jgi:uncharacterized protein